MLHVTRIFHFANSFIISKQNGIGKVKYARDVKHLTRGRTIAPDKKIHCFPWTGGHTIAPYQRWHRFPRQEGSLLSLRGSFGPLHAVFGRFACSFLLGGMAGIPAGGDNEDNNNNDNNNNDNTMKAEAYCSAAGENFAAKTIPWVGVV